MRRSALARTLESLRKTHGWSFRQAAEATGGAVSHATIRNLEQEAVPNPQLATLRSLAAAYGIALEVLLAPAPSTAS